MTDLAGAMADTSKLEPFEGEDVLAAGIEIPGAAGGLREAMKIDPQQFHADQRLFVVMETTVGKIRFDPIMADGERLGWRRVHVLNAEQATFIDGEVVREHLERQKQRIALAKEAAAGIARIPYDDELKAAHDAGTHADGLVEGCVDCDAERDATASESTEAAPAPKTRGRKPKGE